MFAEELSSNAALKRQAQARNRRRRLLKDKKENEKKQKEQATNLKKEEQEKKTEKELNEIHQKSSLILQPDVSLKSVDMNDKLLEKQSNDKPPMSDSITAKAPKMTRQNVTKSDLYSTNSRNNSKSTNPNLNTGGASAIALAAEQRLIRSQLKLRTISAIKIQALYRCFRSNKKIIHNQRESFDKKISDIKTLLSILKSQSQNKNSKAENAALSLSIAYVPPPATSTQLTREFLFLAKYSNCVKQQNQVPNKRHPIASLTPEDQLRLESLIRYVILPGVKTKDEPMQILNVWIQSFVGKQRFMTLLKLCLDYLAYVNIDDKNCLEQESFIIYQYLFTLFVTNDNCKNEDVMRYIQNVLYTDKNKVNLITMLRNLLCGVHISVESSTFIHPSTLVENRESIKKSDKQRMNLFFILVLEVVLKDAKNNLHLYNRFVKEIFTVPLLTWKVDTSILMKNVNATTSPFVLFIQHFFQDIYETILLTNESKHLNAILPSVALNVCPTPSILSLLANLVQLGMSCDHINALNQSQFDYEAATVYFNILTVLFDQCPLGTFTQRAAVEWININSTYTAIPLSPIIIDQCRLILLDSWIRSLFHKAIDPEFLGTDKIMKQKNDLDLKYEKEMMTGDNAMTLAAKEATHERGQGIVWQSSKWAKKLSKTMNNIFAGNANKNLAQTSSKSMKGQGNLVNTSSISKELAHGNKSKILFKDVFTPDAKGKKTLDSKIQKRYTSSFLYSLCRAFATILSRWGGGGDYDIVNQRSLSNDSNKSPIATTKREPSVLGILNVLCFSTSIIETTWGMLQSNDAMKNGLKAFSDPDGSKSYLRDIQIYSTFKSSIESEDSRIGSVILFLFLSSLSHTLLITDDIEIHNDKPLPRHHFRRCILLLKQILYRACFLDVEKADMTTKSRKSYFGLSLLSIASKTMRDLYDRSSRRPLCVPKRWLVDDILSKELAKAKTFEDYVLMLQMPVLSICPYFVPFQRRLVLFNNIVTTSRCNIQGSNATNDLRPGVRVSISRNRVLEDGLLYLNSLGRNALRQRLVVTYLNEAGTQETGVDAGGLLKEFWCDLCALAFDPNYALFQIAQIESGSFLYPNPSSSTAHGSDHITLFGFLGRILGKALYEGITIQPQFSHFFLSFIRGDYNYMHMLSDLSTLDPVLYSNLMFLKTYNGDASDLSLSFTVANDDFGNNKEIELIPNGRNIDVTNYNKERYISLVAKYHVCDRLRSQAEAFTRGLWDVIDPTWLKIFNEPELQVLISGSNSGKIDIADMRAHSRYVGGYTGLDRNIHRFWKVVSNMTPSQQAALLKFVTSCERPPASGFKSMNPPFTIQRIWITRDKDKLPTASTCFNTLKLPTYSSEKVLRQRLLYSIEAGAGFELT